MRLLAFCSYPICNYIVFWHVNIWWCSISWSNARKSIGSAWMWTWTSRCVRNCCLWLAWLHLFCHWLLKMRHWDSFLHLLVFWGLTILHWEELLEKLLRKLSVVQLLLVVLRTSQTSVWFYSHIITCLPLLNFLKIFSFWAICARSRHLNSSFWNFSFHTWLNFCWIRTLLFLETMLSVLVLKH